MRGKRKGYNDDDDDDEDDEEDGKRETNEEEEEEKEEKEEKEEEEEASVEYLIDIRASCLLTFIGLKITFFFFIRTSKFDLRLKVLNQKLF